MSTLAAMRPRGGGRNISPDLIDEDYKRKGAGVTTDTERRTAYYGPTDDPPPLALALALHRFQVSGNPAYSADQFASALAQAVRAEAGLDDGNAGEQQLHHMALDQTRLRSWVQVSRPVTLPAAEHRGLVLSALRRCVREAGVGEAVAEGLFSAPWQAPSHLLRMLAAGAVAEGPPDTPEFKPVDPAFLTKPGLASPSHQGTVDLLAAAVLTDLGKGRIIILTGRAFAGKRRIIAEMLANRWEDKRSIRLVDGTPVRVFARSTCRQLEQLVLDIATFLGIQARDDQPIISQLDRLLAEIEGRTGVMPGGAAAQPPSLYILCDVPPVAHPTGLARQEGLTRLITALHRSGSRILLTSEQATLPGLDRAAAVIISVLDEATAATLRDRLQDVGSAAGRDDDVSSLLRKHDTRVRIDPPLNLLLETLTRLIEGRRGSSGAPAPDGSFSLDVFIGRLTELLGRQRPELDRQPDLEMLVAYAIYEHLDDELRWVLRHLAMSTDGYRVSSLVAIRHGEAIGSAGFMDAYPAMEDRVNRLRGMLHSLLGFDEAVSWPDEDPPGEVVAGDWRCELNIPFRRVFDEMLLAETETQATYRAENRDLSRIAFMRSNWGRLQAQPSRWDGQSDRGRLVQVILRGLVAIDPVVLDAQLARTVGQTAKLTPLSVDVSWSTMFQTSVAGRVEADESTVTADIDYIAYYRFLYFDVFRGDLDLDFRLSKQFNRDDLRLLVLQAFMNPGLAGAALDDGLSFVTGACRPEKDARDATTEPDPEEEKALSRLRKLLSDHECVAFLETAALSASRCEFGRTLADVDRLMRRLPATGCRLHRIYRAQLDYQLLTCGREDTAGSLDSVLKLCTEAIASIEDDPRNKAGTRRDGQQVEAFGGVYETSTALMKMMARRSELLTLMGRTAEAGASFREALTLSGALEAAAQGVVDDWGEWRSVWYRSPFEGQAARRFIRFAYETATAHRDTAPHVAGSEPAGWPLDAAEAMQEANLRRLIRHPPERHTLLLNATLLALARNNWRRAQHLLVHNLSSASLHVGATNTSARYVDASIAMACLRLVRRKLEAPEELDAEPLMRTAKEMIERTLRIANPAANNYPLFWVDGLLAAAEYIQIRRQLLDEHAPTAFAAELDFPQGSHPRTPHALLDSASEVIEKSGYALRTPELERLRR